MKKLLLKLIFGIILIPLTFTSCQKDLVDDSEIMDDVTLKNGIICIDYSGLLAGQNTLVGQVSFSNDATTLYVTFETWDPWYMANTKLCIVTDPSEFPINNGGNPQVGQFPVNTDWPGYTQKATYEFDLADFATGLIYIAVHADVVRIVNGEVVQNETAWGYDCGGTCFKFPGSSWGWYYENYICEP